MLFSKKKLVCQLKYYSKIQMLLFFVKKLRKKIINTVGTTTKSDSAI